MIPSVPLIRLVKNKIFFKVDYTINDEKVFSASFTGNALKLNSKNLIIIFFKKFFQNLKVTSGIYFQALKLYLKGAKYIKKPTKPCGAKNCNPRLSAKYIKKYSPKKI